ncbi:MAG: calcium-binding protein [Pseudomonadota bacterium]|nr:calcium-binding protein [Pseudomonadota bacterium]
MKGPIKTLSAIAVVAAINSFSVVAAEKSHFSYSWIDTWDTDNNQQVTIEEFFKARKTRFDLADENKDGLVNLDEYRNEYENRLDKKIAQERKQSVKQTKMRFNAMDKNDDDIMSKDEYMDIAKRGFDFFDTDKNGMITDEDPKPEYKPRKKTEQKSEEEIKKQQRERKIASAKRVVKMPTTHNKKGMVAIYDANGNGSVSWQEYMAVREEMFARTDENGDGQLVFDEYLAEFENRLDTQIAKAREKRVARTDKRFAILDVDSNGMTFEEFQLSGVRSFVRYDKNKDGKVEFDEKANTQVANRDAKKQDSKL